jgi:hypothetical protein
VQGLLLVSSAAQLTGQEARTEFFKNPNPCYVISHPYSQKFYFYCALVHLIKNLLCPEKESVNAMRMESKPNAKVQKMTCPC